MKYLFAVFLIFSFTYLKAQSDFEMLAYNVLLGSFTSGVGSTINKTPEQKWNEAFFDGAWKGALGGSLTYSGKTLLMEVDDDNDWQISWASKIIHNLGTSFIENGSNNRPIFEQYVFNIGFYRAEFIFKNGFKFNSRIKPISFTLNAYSMIGNRFDLNKSLVYGTPIYTTQDQNLPNASAITHGNSIVFRESLIDNFRLANHEMVHVFQYDEYVGFNSIITKFKQEKRWLNKIDSSIFYLDAHAIMFYLFYFTDELIQGRSFNFLEREAYYFSGEISRNN
ncbi:DUF4157 domain-containing protein [Nonlabens sp. SY33080]|uniref:eCIS core domain-containing protein n=1 Tax=Nonlabens sp. SY33080 TaxID=2719911 RepID=UPI001428B4EC|nr:DUF4157 domain-containing protein [Nonlabens sp. SY33080]